MNAFIACLFLLVVGGVILYAVRQMEEVRARFNLLGAGFSFEAKNKRRKPPSSSSTHDRDGEE